MSDINNIVGRAENLPLFTGIPKRCLLPLLDSLDSQVIHFENQETVARLENLPADCLCIIEGSAQIANTDMSGNKSILFEFAKGDILPSRHSFLKSPFLQGGIIATSSLYILRLRLDSESNPSFIDQIKKNALALVSKNNKELLEHLLCVSERSSRNKLLAYLRLARDEAAADTFTIPKSRQRLADYLFIDRSALSRELSRLQKDGIISYRKNTFTLLEE